MPDWEKLVRRGLAGLALGPEEQREVFAELASHPEETYESLRKEGVSKQDAVRRTLSQVRDWNDLQRKIRSARMKEDTMNTRVTRFWRPSLITFTLSSVLLAANQIFGPRPTVLHSGKLPLIMLFIPWLLCLPLVGAAGAYLSRRAGAPLGIMLISSIFPVLPFAVAFLIVLPVALVLDHHVGHTITITGFLTGWFVWIVVPAAALIAGGLLAALVPSRHSLRGVTAE